MPAHSFLFHPSNEELPHYIAALEKVEAQDKFRGVVAIDLQLHTGTWVGEISTLTSRKMMDFITEVTMELPPEEKEDVWQTSDQEADHGTFVLTADGPTSFTDAVETASDEEVEEDYPEEYDLSEMSEEEADKSYEEHEKAAGRSVPPKKLKKPASVGKTTNPAITVEED